MEVLGIKEFRCLGDFGCHVGLTCFFQCGVVVLTRLNSRLLLFRRKGVDHGPVLGADVIALTHALSRVVVFPKQLQKR